MAPNLYNIPLLSPMPGQSLPSNVGDLVGAAVGAAIGAASVTATVATPPTEAPAEEATTLKPDVTSMPTGPRHHGIFVLGSNDVETPVSMLMPLTPFLGGSGLFCEI